MLNLRRGVEAVEVLRPSTRFNTEVTISQVFNRKSEKVPGFVMACNLFIRMKIREVTVEEQVQ